MAKNIQQKVVFKVMPDVVYSALIESKQHAAFTGGKAKIINKVGGAFSVWDGYAEGLTLYLEKNKKIVQAWRASDWLEGEYSIVVFKLSDNKGGTLLEFSQYGVPDDFAKDIAGGWKQYYWEPMKDYFSR